MAPAVERIAHQEAVNGFFCYCVDKMCQTLNADVTTNECVYGRRCKCRLAAIRSQVASLRVGVFAGLANGATGTTKNILKKSPKIRDD